MKVVKYYGHFHYFTTLRHIFQEIHHKISNINAVKDSFEIFFFYELKVNIFKINIELENHYIFPFSSIFFYREIP